MIYSFMNISYKVLAYIQLSAFFNRCLKVGTGLLRRYYRATCIRKTIINTPRNYFNVLSATSLLFPDSV